MDYKLTLHLPRTDFPIRPQAAIDDPRLIERWKAIQLDELTAHEHEGKTPFVLHDGPPYANGPIHLGHAYNKIVKDVIAKSHRMMGHHVAVRPGWDCHGLPIELQVTTKYPELAGNRLELMKACRAWAHGWIDVQRSAFWDLGVLMTWQRPYITMDPGYEAATLRSLGQLCTQGYVARKLKTVAWCPSCQTTLASAEIEYQDRTDPSLYVAFTCVEEDIYRFAPAYAGQSISLLVWTTTPWTLPLNRAVMVHPAAEYVVTEIQGKLYVVGKEALAHVAQQVGVSLTPLLTFPASALTGCQVKHPFIEGQVVPVIFDISVGLQEGTAAVHVAPGCGPIDYEIGVKQGLEIFCPVGPAGQYTKGIVPAALEGMSVRDGQGWVITALKEAGTLVHKGSIKHSYPHCWRCRQGLIFRATAQWFIDLAHDDMQDKSLRAVDTIQFYPKNSRNFLKATVAHRWEWCISRQRVWGVPIPALICKECDRALMTEPLVHAVAQGIAHEGVEYWHRIGIDQLTLLIPDQDPCKTHTLVKEQDILDVWFDSGVSHTAVLKADGQFPADIYVEGVDQHRGWFQSSLLTSMALYEQPPMKGIFSHGYTVDEKGRKMSKSLGNVVAPQDIVAQLGTDGLRLWAASISHEGDLTVSPKVLDNVSQTYRKIRNTARFLLQNMYDFDPRTDRVLLEQLGLLDQYAYARLAQVQQEIVAAYRALDLTLACTLIAQYCTHDLSAHYLDMVKDRLYTDRADSVRRRAAQTVMYDMLTMLVGSMAPVLSFTAELIYELLPVKSRESVHLTTFWQPETHRAYDEQAWQGLWALRDHVLKALEVLRAQGTIKASLEAQVTLQIHAAAYPEYAQIKAYLESDFLRELFIVSQIAITYVDDSAAPGIQVLADHAAGTKCPRCWQWHTQVDAAGLCDRCHDAVEVMSATDLS